MWKETMPPWPFSSQAPSASPAPLGRAILDISSCFLDQICLDLLSFVFPSVGSPFDLHSVMPWLARGTRAILGNVHEPLRQTIRPRQAILAPSSPRNVGTRLRAFVGNEPLLCMPRSCACNQFACLQGICTERNPPRLHVLYSMRAHANTAPSPPTASTPPGPTAPSALCTSRATHCAAPAPPTAPRPERPADHIRGRAPPYQHPVCG